MAIVVKKGLIENQQLESKPRRVIRKLFSGPDFCKNLQSGFFQRIQNEAFFNFIIAKYRETYFSSQLQTNIMNCFELFAIKLRGLRSIQGRNRFCIFTVHVCCRSSHCVFQLQAVGFFFGRTLVFRISIQARISIQGGI